jgi:hypothetical protein
MLNKKIINKFGKHFLLGINQDGEYVWLKKESWDCNWYWGFGYLHTYTNNKQPERSRDISAHFHFDSTFLNGKECARDMFKKYFKSTVLTDSEIWELVDYMQTFYTLKEVAELFKNGYSHQTERAKIETLKSEDQRDLVNKVWLPEVFKRIEALLTPAE